MSKYFRGVLRFFAEACVGAEAAAELKNERKLRLANENLKVSPQNLDAEWISKDGRKFRVADMEVTHCKNALGMIMRQLRDDKVAYINSKDMIAFAPAMHNFIDGEIGWRDEVTASFGVTNRKGNVK